MTTNAQLIALCQRITDLAEASDLLRAYARLETDMHAQDEALRTASSLDDNLCQLCTELRLACRPRAVEELPECVAAVVLDEFT